MNEKNIDKIIEMAGDPGNWSPTPELIRDVKTKILRSDDETRHEFLDAAKAAGIDGKRLLQAALKEEAAATRTEPEWSIFAGARDALGHIRRDRIRMPEEIIPGTLAKAEKMMVAAPQKAGKSFLMLELASAFAEGKEWLGVRLKRSRVLYVNAEIPRARMQLRACDVRDAMGVKDPEGAVDIVSLREIKAPDKTLGAMKEHIVAEARWHGADVIILDCLYKLLDGDESNATDCAKFCGYVDEIIRETGAAVITVHHYTKGIAAQKSEMDRASGSSVLLRDADAIMTLSQLESDDPRIPEGATAWEVGGGQRNHRMERKRILFDYPVHVVDTCGMLDDAVLAGTGKCGTTVTNSAKRGKNVAAEKSPEELLAERIRALDDAYERARNGWHTDRPTVGQVAAALGVSEKTARSRISEAPAYGITTGKVVKTPAA